MAILTCPSCGSDRFAVQVTAWATLVPDFDALRAEAPASFEWADTSRARCRTCGLEAPLGEFRSWAVRLQAAGQTEDVH